MAIGKNTKYRLIVATNGAFLLEDRIVVMTKLLTTRIAEKSCCHDNYSVQDGCIPFMIWVNSLKLLN